TSRRPCLRRGEVASHHEGGAAHYQRGSGSTLDLSGGHARDTVAKGSDCLAAQRSLLLSHSRRLPRRLLEPRTVPQGRRQPHLEEVMERLVRQAGSLSCPCAASRHRYFAASILVADSMCSRARAAASRTLALLSFRSRRISGKAFLAAAPICPSDRTASRRTRASASPSTWISAGTASLASGPIW